MLYCERCKVTSQSDPGSISKAMNVCCSVCIIEKKENLSQTCLISFCVNNDFKIYIYLYKYIYITRVCVHADALYNLRFVSFLFVFFLEKTIFLWITAKFTRVDPWEVDQSLVNRCYFVNFTVISSQLVHVYKPTLTCHVFYFPPRPPNLFFCY